MLKTGDDGSLQPLSQSIEHQGYSSNFTRQSKPHVHCTLFSSDNKYVFANDLGTDKVYQYKFNSSDNQQPLSETDTALYEVPDGFGPRHITFHPNKKFAYLINELSGKVIAYQYNGARLTELQTIESTTVGDKQDKGSADIHITPNGQYLYTTNRGASNIITIYRVGSTGLLTLIGNQSCGGIHPRNFTIDPTGKYLLVANRDSNNIVVFTIVKSTGFLEATGQTISINKPMFVKMLNVK
jgi:6-phosphogluconolactonase